MKLIFEKWFDHGTKYIGLHSYKDSWEKPQFWCHNNGAKKKNGDRCFDFNCHFFYLAFEYTNWDLQGFKKTKNKES